jgi:hypothetical protein
MRPQSKGELYEIVSPQEIKYIDPVDWNNIMVRDQASNGKLISINEELYNKIA